MTPLGPGPDEVITSAPDGQLCNSRSCANARRAADVLVTFGTFGSHWDRTPFWPECWGRTYPMCDPCWTRTWAVLQRSRPDLTVRQVPATGPSSPAHLPG